MKHITITLAALIALAGLTACGSSSGSAPCTPDSTHGCIILKSGH